jgi:hypothetical protein
VELADGMIEQLGLEKGRIIIQNKQIDRYLVGVRYKLLQGLHLLIDSVSSSLHMPQNRKRRDFH